MTAADVLEMDLGRGLPANVEAERSILGAILLDNRAYNEATEHLKPEDFSLDSHRVDSLRWGFEVGAATLPLNGEKRQMARV
jgi:hypothetical protein